MARTYDAPTKNGWIAVDLDGTLAEYESFKGADVIGKPIPLMVERIRRWLADGYEVRIFTARVSEPNPVMRERCHQAIYDYTKEHIGVGLKATNIKDYAMIEQWDDRAIQVIPNTGVQVGNQSRLV